MIEPGQILATDFTIKVCRNGVEQTVNFGELLSRPAIVSVYMRNNTGSCDKQNASLVAQARAIAAEGFDLIALSRDTCSSHAKYGAKMGIEYILASDPDDLFSKAAHSIVEKSMYGKKYSGPARAAFLFDSGGKVLAVIEKVDSARHGEELLALIKRLRSEGRTWA